MITSILEQGLTSLRLKTQIPPEAVPQLDRYAQLLLEKNQVMNLTAITDPEQVARLHMLDCASLLAFQDLSGKRLLDVGTGAGFPGMVLKILVPTLDVTLLDSLNKRLDWLNEVCSTLNLSGIRTVHTRAEEGGRDPNLRERFDVVTSRAVAELPTLCELCLPYVKVGGIFLAMKSINADQELAASEKALQLLGARLEQVEDYTIPGTDIQHRAILLKKTAATPKTYPRPFAKIKKKPL